MRGCNAVYITGRDADGKECSYRKIQPERGFESSGGYLNERGGVVTSEYFKRVVIPSIVKIRFGSVELGRLEWVELGCPDSL